MILALESKNKMGFLDGFIIEPVSGDPMRSLWERNDTFIRSWIVRSLSSKIAQCVMFIKNASDLWSQRFAQGYHMRIAYLNEELYSIREGSIHQEDDWIC